MNSLRQTTWKGAGACLDAGGFTLFEVLATMLIIAILMAALVGGLNGARQMAWRTKTRDTARQLAGAWNLYLNDNRAFPKAGELGDPAPGGFWATMANLDVLNKDRIYIELSAEERESFGRQGGGLIDKWGNHFGFALDLDYDGMVENPAPEVYGDREADYAKVRASALAWSQGQTPENKRKWIVQW